jgi:DNA-binding NarL/FixJ family response regulator
LSIEGASLNINRSRVPDMKSAHTCGVIGSSSDRFEEVDLPPDPSELPLRSRQTLTLLLEGLSESQIAESMGLSRGTVHKYVTGIYRHFGVSGRAELMALWIPKPRGGQYPWLE